MESSVVMRGLDPCIHLLQERWIAESSPAMTFPPKQETLWRLSQNAIDEIKAYSFVIARSEAKQ